MIRSIEKWIAKIAFRHSEFTFMGVFKGMPVLLVFKRGILVRYYLPKEGSFQDLKVFDNAVEGKQFRDLIDVMQREYE